jgi:hypothetical protein
MIAPRSAIRLKFEYMRWQSENYGGRIKIFIPTGTGFSEQEKMASNMIESYNDLGWRAQELGQEHLLEPRVAVKKLIIKRSMIIHLVILQLHVIAHLFTHRPLT